MQKLPRYCITVITVKDSGIVTISHLCSDNRQHQDTSSLIGKRLSPSGGLSRLSRLSSPQTVLTIRMISKPIKSSQFKATSVPLLVVGRRRDPQAMSQYSMPHSAMLRYHLHSAMRLLIYERLSSLQTDQPTVAFPSNTHPTCLPNSSV
jgi:hypothetical protein